MEHMLRHLTEPYALTHKAQSFSWNGRKRTSRSSILGDNDSASIGCQSTNNRRKSAAVQGQQTANRTRSAATEAEYTKSGRQVPPRWYFTSPVPVMQEPKPQPQLSASVVLRRARSEQIPRATTAHAAAGESISHEVPAALTNTASTSSTTPWDEAVSDDVAVAVVSPPSSHVHDTIRRVPDKERHNKPDPNGWDSLDLVQGTTPVTPSPPPVVATAPSEDTETVSTSPSRMGLLGGWFAKKKKAKPYNLYQQSTQQVETERRRMLSNPYRMYRASSSNSAKDEQDLLSAMRKAEEQKKKFLSTPTVVKIQPPVVVSPPLPPRAANQQTLEGKMAHATAAVTNINVAQDTSPGNESKEDRGSEENHTTSSLSTPPRRQVQAPRESKETTTNNTTSVATPKRESRETSSPKRKSGESKSKNRSPSSPSKQTSSPSKHSSSPSKSVKKTEEQATPSRTGLRNKAVESPRKESTHKTPTRTLREPEPKNRPSSSSITHASTPVRKTSRRPRDAPQSRQVVPQRRAAAPSPSTVSTRPIESVPSKISMIVTVDSMEVGQFERTELKGQEKDRMDRRERELGRRYEVPLHGESYEEDDASESSASDSTSVHDLSCESSQSDPWQRTNSYSFCTDDDFTGTNTYDKEYTDDERGDRRDVKGRRRSPTRPSRRSSRYDEPTTTFEHDDNSTLESGSYFSPKTADFTANKIEFYRNQLQRQRQQRDRKPRRESSWDGSDLVSNASHLLSRTASETSYFLTRTASGVSESVHRTASGLSKRVYRTTSGLSESLNRTASEVSEALWEEGDEDSIISAISAASSAFASTHEMQIRRTESHSTTGESAFNTIKPDKTERVRLQQAPSMLSDGFHSDADGDTDIELDRVLSNNTGGWLTLCGLFG